MKVVQLLFRLWPFPRGAGRIIDRFFAGLSFPFETAKVRTTDGFEITVMPNELIGRHIYLSGEFDRTIVEVLLHFAEPGDVLLDVGANIGYVSACFLNKVRSSSVIAVEPEPKVVHLLRENLKQFGERARVAPVALSDSDGKGHLQLCTGNTGASKLTADKTAETTVVEVWSPHRLLSAFDVTRIDLIKIDVEGHEETVFGALKEALLRFRPRMILFEDQTSKAAPNEPIGSVLTSLGYKVVGIRKRLTRLEFVPISDKADCRFHDYVARLDA